MLSSLTSLVTLLLATTSVFAATQTIVVGQNGTKTFTPNNIQAVVGDIINLQFVAGNHTATQSTFANPCTAAGFKSGFKPANTTNQATFSIRVNSTDPIWVYCGQVGHCQVGMVMAINAPATGNSTFEAFQAAAEGSSNGNSTSGSTGSTGSGSGGSEGSTGSDSGSSSGSASGGSGSGTATASGSAASASKSSGAASTILPPATGLVLLVSAALYMLM